LVIISSAQYVWSDFYAFLRPLPVINYFLIKIKRREKTARCWEKTKGNPGNRGRGGAITNSRGYGYFIEL
jgi:hypothetical protein